jgi:methylglyoxal synthase
MVKLVEANRDKLDSLELFATRSTGELIKQSTGLLVTLVQSGPLGGDQQIGSLVTSGIVNAVIFLRDPLTSQPHEPDISALLRVCDVHNVPLATNLATAETVLCLLIERPDKLSEASLEAKLHNGLAIVY